MWNNISNNSISKYEKNNIIQIFAISCLILASVHFQHTNMKWVKHGYGSLGALELSCIIIAIIVIGFGFFALMTNNKLITLH